MCNTSKKSSEKKTSLNVEMIFEFFFYCKNEKKNIFRFSILKISWCMLIAVNFQKSLGKKSENYFNRA